MRNDFLRAHENKWFLPRVESWLLSRNEALRSRSSLFLSGATCGVQLQHELAVLARTKGSFVPSPRV